MDNPYSKKPTSNIKTRKERFREIAVNLAIGIPLVGSFVAILILIFGWKTVVITAFLAIFIRRSYYFGASFKDSIRVILWALYTHRYYKPILDSKKKDK